MIVNALGGGGDDFPVWQKSLANDKVWQETGLPL
jgi:hypothetical protein